MNSSSSPRPAKAKCSTTPRSRNSTGARGDLDYTDEAGLHGLFEQVSGTYAATDETHDEARWAEVAEDRRRTGRGIEVGHIFYFGDKYSDVDGPQGFGPGRQSMVTPQMGSYGIGVVAPGRRDHRGEP